MEAARIKTEQRRRAAQDLRNAGTLGPVASTTESALAVREAAAVRWAEGNEVEAVRRLVEHLRATRGVADEAVWWELMDAYTAQRQRQAFENLALLYARQFARSAPPWIPPPPPPPPPPGIAMDEPVAQIPDARWRAWRHQISQCGSGLLDVSRIQVRERGLGEDDAQALADQMRRTRRLGIPVRLMGEHAMRQRAEAEVAAEDFGGRGWWMLLFEVLAWRGLAQEHERLAHRFLDRYKTSPPEMPLSAPVFASTPVETVMPQVWTRDDIERAWPAWVEEPRSSIDIDASAWVRMTFDAAERWRERMDAESARRAWTVREPSELLIALWDVAGLTSHLDIRRRRRA